MDRTKPLTKYIAMWWVGYSGEWRKEDTLEAVRAKIPKRVVKSGKYRIYHVDETAHVDDCGSLCYYNRELVEGLPN